MTITLVNKKSVSIRLLEKDDNDLLLAYLQALSAESRSRFGPHPFDAATVNDICHHLPGDTSRYIAIDTASGKIAAYMLVKNGMMEWDRLRYANRQQYFDEAVMVTYAPSVADEWQSSGLGSALHAIIEAALKNKGMATIVLWGGVQATNKKALGFYTKFGYRIMGAFRQDDKDNYDMLKTL